VKTNDASKAFEAYFYRQMLSQAGVGKSAFGGGGAAGATFADMFTEALADQMASSGELGVGRMLEQAIAPQAMGSGPLSFRPVEGSISSSFGLREDPIDGHHKHHHGLDIAAPEGAPVRAAGGGVVASVEDNAGGYGKTILIDHGDGLTTRYAHLSEMNVTQGQRVEAGAVVGRVGQTGRSTGPHLHFEVRSHDHPIDPENVLPPLTRR
jgi:murein DD-endopeptidase MepM/ murein hydrolase activator NlpD